MGRALLGPQEGRQGHRQGPRRRLRVHDRRDQLARHARPPTKGGSTPWTGPTSWRRASRAPQVVNDSKTPVGHRPRREPPRSRDPRRDHARAARARRRDHAPLRRRRPRPDGRPGAPVARRHRARDGPPARPRPGSGRRLPRRPTPATSPRLFIDTFAGLGILPDRYYWMSDIYPTGQVDPFIRTALDRAPVVREVYRRVANVQHPDHWLPLGVDLPELRQGRDDDRVGLGRRDGRRRVPARPRRLGHGLRLDRAGSRRSAATRSSPWNLEWAAQWSLFGVTIEPNGKDLATAGGSRDRSDAIAREVFELEPPLNFPYEFLNIAGKKMSTSKGRGAAAAHDRRDRAAGAVAVPVRPAAAGERDRVRPRGHRRGPAPVRRVRPARAPPPRAARSRASCRRASTRSSATRCSTRRRTSTQAAAAFRPAFAHLALLVQVPGMDVAARVEAEKGAPLTDARGRRASRSASARSAAGSRRTRPSARAIEVRRDALPGRGRPAAPGAARVPAGPRRGRRTATPPRRGEQWQAAIFAVAAEHGLDAKAAFNALYLAFLGRPNGPRAGWLLASLERDFVIGRLHEAGGEQGRRSHERRRPAAPRGAGPDPPGRDRQARGPVARRSRDRGRRDAAASSGRVATRSRPSATRPRKQIGEAIRGGATPDGPEVAELRRRVDASRRADRRDRRRARRGRGRARRPPPAHPEPGRPRRPGRRRGGERHGPNLGRAARPTRRAGADGGADVGAAAALGDRRGARHHRQRARREDRRLGLPRLQGRRVAPPARADRLVPRRPHARARLHRGLAAGRRERGVGARARARSRTRKTRCTSSPATTCTWSPRPRSRSPTCTATRSSRRRTCRSATPPTRRASGARRAPPARTRAASCASTSSTRSRWCCSRSPRTARRRSSG